MIQFHWIVRNLRIVFKGTEKEYKEYQEKFPEHTIEFIPFSLVSEWIGNNLFNYHNLTKDE